MKVQIIQDNNGKDTGVFIPIDDWLIIKRTYPNIEEVNDDVPLWEKELIDNRLEVIASNPEKLRPGADLLDELRQNHS